MSIFRKFGQIERKAMPARIRALGDDEVEVVLSTDVRALDGHILEPEGCVLDSYRDNPIVLREHDPNKVVGNAEDMKATKEGVTQKVRFAPKGISAVADETRGLVKAGVIRTMSVNFIPLEGAPIDKAKGAKGGMRFTKWRLLESSFVAVPADPTALVTARAKQENDFMADWKVGAARNLPIEDSDDWDGAAAERSIFEYAGGDDFDPAKARRGFLVYDADKPDDRGSYKLPIAHAVDGELKVPKGGIRAAASRIPDTDVPDDVKKRAQAVLDAYKKKAKIGDESDDEKRAALRSSLKRALALGNKRGLYDVSQLAYCLCMLGYHHESAVIEAAVEEDGSEVPAMLGEALKLLAEAFLAMAEEETHELLEDHDLGEEEAAEGVDGADGRAFVRAAKTSFARAWRRGIALFRKGKVLSTSNKDKLEEADDHHTRALKKHRSLGENHEAVGDHLAEARTAHERAEGHAGDLGEQLEGMRSALAAGDMDEAKRCMDRAASHHKKLVAAHDDVGEAHDEMADRHADVSDDHKALGRSVKSAQRCVRSVLGTSQDGEESDDEKARKARLAETEAARQQLAA